MTIKDKLLYLQKSMTLNEREFCSRFKIKNSIYKKLLLCNNYTINKNELVYLCNQFRLDVDDFIDERSTVSLDNIKKDEHPCKMTPFKSNTDVIFEDYAREDNSRYEEKD